MFSRMCVGSLRQHVFASKDVRPLQDVVNDFRGRGIQIALAMVGNRLDRSRPYQARLCGAQALVKEYMGHVRRTFRKSGLTNSAKRPE